MRYPLLWKELRESRLALLAGFFWMLGPIEFWLKYARVQAPWPVKMILIPSLMFAAGTCMVLLGVARFSLERHSGTWEFLQTRPVSLRRAVAVKWLVALALTVAFISFSSGVAWYPITRLEPLHAGMGLLAWIWMHAACASLFVAILLLIDTCDWGEWLALRVAITFTLILTFFWLVHQEFNKDWIWPTLYAVVAVSMGATAISLAPWLARESLLPNWRSAAGPARRHAGPTLAWLWLQWRQVRFVVLLLMAPAPLLVAVITIPGLMAASSLRDQLEVVAGMLPTLSRMTPGLLCISVGLLGWLMPLVESYSRTDTFRCSLPFSRRRMHFLRLLFALTLLQVLFLPNIGIGIARALLLTGVSISQIVTRLAGHWCAAVATLGCMLFLSSVVASARVRFAGPAAGVGGILLIVYLVDQFLGVRSLPLAAVAAVTLAIVLTVATVLPLIDERREF